MTRSTILRLELAVAELEESLVTAKSDGLAASDVAAFRALKAELRDARQALREAKHAS